MSNVNNDQRILELKKQIEVKKEKLKQSEKFSPITNLSIEFENTRFNLNVATKSILIDLAIKLNMMLISFKDLRLSEEYKISGYKLEDWIADIKAKLNILSRKDEERNLKVLEDKLSKMLSEDKKIELELNEIADLLK
jgi:hypothetical protein